MASGQSADSSDRLGCSICHDYFSEPKLLPCGHLLCRHCLLSWMQSKDDARCPLCRSLIVKPGERRNQTNEDISNGLPTDLSIVRLVEAKRILSKKHKCCVCEDVAATSLCLNCRDTMCASCAKIHVKFSMARNHTVEDLLTLTPEKLAKKRCTAICMSHTGELCEHYCSTHDVSICHLCATSRHQSCPEVKELEKKVEDARTTLGQLVAKLKAGEMNMVKSIRELDQHLQETEKKTNELIMEVDRICGQLEFAIEDCRFRLKNLLLNAFSDVKEAVQDVKAYLLEQKGKLTCHKIVTERVQEITTPDDVISMATVMKNRVDDLDSTATLPDNAKVISEVSLEVDPETLSILEKMLKELGEVTNVPVDILASKPFPTEWRFHDNHGTHVVLSNNNQTADRVTGTTPQNGIVLSHHPVEINTIYQVELEETLSNWGYVYNMVGVAVQDPDTLTLPSHIYRGCPFAIVVNYQCVLNQGSQTIFDVGAPLQRVRKGNRVGVLVDGRMNLHLYIDEENLGVVALDVPQPCFVLFDLHACWKKITTLPLQRIMT